MDTKLIAFSGPINSGKSTATNMLQYCLNSPKLFRQYWLYKLFKGKTLFKKWKQTSFAYPLKKILSILINSPLENFENRSFKEGTYVSLGEAKAWMTLNDNQFNKAIKRDDTELLTSSKLTIRQLMQWFGSTIMPKYFGENVWVKATLSQPGNFIISDVRFKKEAKAIHAKGGKIILIERPNTGKASNHISEKEWKEMKDEGVYDFVIQNNGSQKELFNSVKNILLER